MTNDLISRSALLEALDNGRMVFKSTITVPEALLAQGKHWRRCLDAAPAVDAVEVVRCYKCKQSERMSSPFGTVVHCHCWGKDVDYDGFCHEGY